MRFLKLRIAWSALCGIASVLLIVLWVRGYSWEDQLNIPLSDTRVVCPQSIVGTVSFGFCTAPEAKFMWPKGLKSHPVTDDMRLPGFSYGEMGNPQLKSTVDFVLVPYWFVFLLTAAVGAVPWIRWPVQFNTRTVLVTITLVAVALGLAFYFKQKAMRSATDSSATKQTSPPPSRGPNENPFQ